jgi:hypothetical protein
MITLLISLISISQAKDLHYKYEWETSPTIQICPDATIDKQDVEDAISYWESEGVDTSFIREITTVSYCNLRALNVIQITGDIDIRPDEYGATLVKWYRYSKNKNSTLYVHRATVQIPENSKEKVILHEIGHSLGLGHDSHHSVMKVYPYGY